MGLATGAEALQRHDLHDMPLFACLSCPDADRSGLDLVSDWVCWWSIWSDFPDGEGFIREQGRASGFFASLADVVDPSKSQSPPVLADPHVAAFADIWERWRQGMSAIFVARTKKNWEDWFDSYATRCEHRREGRLLDVAAYLALRDLTGAVRLEMDAAERVGDYEVPQPVLESSPVQAMRLITMRAINITQDVQSLAKEESAGDLHNMVIVLEGNKPACGMKSSNRST